MQYYDLKNVLCQFFSGGSLKGFLDLSSKQKKTFSQLLFPWNIYFGMNGSFGFGLAFPYHLKSCNTWTQALCWIFFAVCLRLNHPNCNFNFKNDSQKETFPLLTFFPPRKLQFTKWENFKIQFKFKLARFFW